MESENSTSTTDFLDCLTIFETTGIRNLQQDFTCQIGNSVTKTAVEMAFVQSKSGGIEEFFILGNLDLRNNWLTMSNLCRSIWFYKDIVK